MSRGGQQQRISTSALVALIYFSVAGTPAGIEDTVVAAGPLVALIMLIVIPLVWSVPEALVTAELAAMFPEGNGGYVVWVTAAFGEFFGFQEGVLSWLSGVVDNAIYPVMIVNYSARIWPSLDEGYSRYICCLSILTVLTMVNLTGLRIVGKTAVIILLLSLLPFVVMIGFAIPKVHASRWLDTLPKGETIDWQLLLNTLFWNLNYFDSASTMVGEIENPTKVFPRALAYAVLLIVLQYLVPLLIATGVIPWEEFQEDSFAACAEIVGGSWLRGWLVAGIGISAIGLFQAEMSSDSFELLGMAEMGMLPAAFAKRSRFGAPYVGILLSYFIIGGLVILPFASIVEILNMLYIMAAILEFSAFLYLRIKSPTQARPFRVPLGIVGLSFMFVPGAGLMGFMVYSASWETWVATGAGVTISLAVTYLSRTAREKKWCKFLLPEDTTGGEKVEKEHENMPLLKANESTMF